MTRPTRLPIVRIDPSGHVVVEDAATGESKRLDAEAGMRALLDDQTATTHTEGIQSDWIANGWRPSLEYHLWSERPSVQGIPGAATRRCAAVPQVDHLLLNRRTVREFESESVSAADFAALVALPNLDLGEGISMRLVTYAVEGLTAGVWKLDSPLNTPSLVAAGDLRALMSKIMCGMPAALTAALTVVLVMDAQRRQQAYPYERALRETYIHVGRVAQHLIVAAEARNLGTLITPATNDIQLSDLLQLPRRTYPLYTVTVGHKRRVRQ